MRMFNRYAPALIAKHVSRLFNGEIHISGQGDFEFTHGRVQVPSNAEIMHYRTVKEINAEISRLRELY